MEGESRLVFIDFSLCPAASLLGLDELEGPFCHLRLLQVGFHDHQRDIQRYRIILIASSSFYL